MISVRKRLTGKVSKRLNLTGKLNTTIKHITPELEDLKATPTKEQQIFKSEKKYGYNEVTVEAIPDNYIEPKDTITITENGQHNVREYETADVNVEVNVNLQDKEVMPTKEIQTITYDENFDGLNNVTVKAIGDEYIIPNGTIELTTNGTHNIKDYENVTVNVDNIPDLQDKEVTPTKETQTVVADEGFDGLNNVVVNPIPNEYIVPNLQDKTITITENGTQNITADEGFDGLNSVEVTTNVAGGGSEPVVEPDYITDGLISWWEGEDGFDENGQWHSRVGTDYIKSSYFLYGAMNSNPPICSGGAIYNDGVHGMTTQQDYCVQNYTIQAVGCLESFKNTNGATMNMLIAFNMGASPMIGVNYQNNAMFANGSNLSQSASYNVAGKTFSGTLYLYDAPVRGTTTSSALNLRCSVNGSNWFTSTASSSTHASQGSNMAVLCYYEKTYRSCGAKLYSLRVYNRELTLEELQHNYEIDKARFNITE